MRALQIPKPQGAQLQFRVLRSLNLDPEETMATSTQKVGAVFAAWCKFTETERAEFDQMIAGVQTYLQKQTQVNAGTKAAQTRKRKEPPVLKTTAAIGETA